MHIEQCFHTEKKGKLKKFSVKLYMQTAGKKIKMQYLNNNDHK